MLFPQVETFDKTDVPDALATNSHDSENVIAHENWVSNFYRVMLCIVWSAVIGIVCLCFHLQGGPKKVSQ